MAASARRVPVSVVCTGDTPARVEKFRRETGLACPIYLDDGDLAKAFEVVSSPTFFVIDRQGKVLSRSTKPPRDLP